MTAARSAPSASTGMAPRRRPPPRECGPRPGISGIFHQDEISRIRQRGGRQNEPALHGRQDQDTMWRNPHTPMALELIRQSSPQARKSMGITIARERPVNCGARRGGARAPRRLLEKSFESGSPGENGPEAWARARAR